GGADGTAPATAGPGGPGGADAAGPDTARSGAGPSARGSVLFSLGSTTVPVGDYILFPGITMAAPAAALARRLSFRR
ncbi:hypothetical protein ABT155_35755, partial [Streptomyces hirsutus]